MKKMKTSNLILTLTGILLLIMLIGLAGAGARHTRLAILKGEGNVISVDREVQPYTQVAVSHGIKLIDDRQLAGKVRIEVDSALLEYIQVSHNEGELKISRSQRISRGRACTVYASLNGVSRFHVSSGARIQSKDTLKGKKLDMAISSGGKVNLSVDGNSCQVSVSSGGQGELSGKTEFLKLDISSGARFKGKELQALNATVNGSSGANAGIHVSDELRANLSSGCHVSYKGNPALVHKNLSSGAHLNRE